MRRSFRIPWLLQERSVGKGGRHVFQRRVAALRQENMELLEDTQIVVQPQRGGYVTSLDMDRVQDRFLLAGGSDAIVSVYDLSPWGTEHQLGIRRSSTPVSIFKPVAQSIRAPPSSIHNAEDVPPGHSHSVLAAQWYPVDTGAFVSASAEGSIMVWDTETLTPVVRWRPFETCRCFDMPRSGIQPLLLAVGSDGATNVKLVDLRSGASSHSLVGHNGGITVTRWSPTCHTVLASGGLDGTIRLWDIRKSGSNACLAVLNRDGHHNMSVSQPYTPNHAHLASKRKSLVNAATLAPNNYRRAESNAVVSHSEPISAISFTPDGHFLVSTGRDGRLQQWDLRAGSGQLVPTQYSAPAYQPAVSMGKKVPLVVTQSTAWVGNGQRLLGYSLERGGTPTQILQGHMHNVSCLTSQEGWMRLVSGGKDGMILLWGCPSQPARRKRMAIAGNGHEAKRHRGATEDRDNW